MSTVYYFTVGSITWRYTLFGGNAILGDGAVSYGGASTYQALIGEISIPSVLNGYTVTRFSNYAFWQCPNITSFNIPVSVTSFGTEAFAYCIGLTSVNFIGSITSISQGAFYGCSGLTTLTIPNSVTSIVQNAFGSCTGLTSVTIGNSVTSIGDYAFYDCTALKSVTIPNSVTSIGASAFYNTSTALTVIMNTGKFGITSPTAQGTTVGFFGNPAVKVVLPLTMTITSTTPGVTSGSKTNNASIALTFSSSASTIDFQAEDISFNRGSLTSFDGSGSVYTATFAPTIQGAYTINVAENKFTSVGQNNNSSNTFNWTYDSVSPSMIITSTTPGVSSGSTTNNTSIALTFTASESITGFQAVDISFNRGTLTSFGGGGSVYTATFTQAGQGVYIINVPVGAYTDAAGNSNADATTFNWTYDSVSPTMTITSNIASGSTSNNASIPLTFTASEAITGFQAGDISFNRGSLTSFDGSGSVYTATFTQAGQGAYIINVPVGAYTDAVGNSNAAATTFNWTYDSVSPTMSITSTISNNSTTNIASIPLTFTASEAITGFQAVDISFNRGTLTAFDGSGSVYTATFTQAGQGAYIINVPVGAYTDPGGNSNTAATSFNWTYDSIPPTMTITSTTAGVTSGSTTNNKFIALTFTSSKATTNFVKDDIILTNGKLSPLTGSGTVYNATFTPTGPGACTISVLQGAYTDAVGNSNIDSTFNWTTTAWNIDMSANHLIKSYVKDFVDVSGMVVLRENANLYISGNAETAGSLSLNRLFVTADASFNRRIFVGGDVSMNGNVAMIGDLSMNGTVTKCNFNNSSIPKSAFSGAVPDGADYNTSKIVYDQTFQANDDVSMNGATFASNNVKVSGNIVFNDGTVMNTYDNNILSTNPTVFKTSTFTSLDICGNLVAGSYATSSDYRIKTNIVELDETYTVDKLRPVKYYQTQINREKYGLIAHELQEHYPDLVIGEKDGSELQRVNYTGLIAILINDIKRLKNEITELELHQR